MREQENPYLEEARGGYIGPIERDEALDAIRSHSTGPMIVDYPEHGFAGGPIRRAQGWQAAVGGINDNNETAVFAFAGRQVPLGSGIGYADAFVLDLSSEGWTAERYSGGLDLHFSRGAVVRLVFWHSIYHETETSDLAPGIGPATIRIEEHDGDDDE